MQKVIAKPGIATWIVGLDDPVNGLADARDLLGLWAVGQPDVVFGVDVEIQGDEVGAHAFAHIIAATFETLSIAILVFIGPVEEKNYVDVTANAVYWYFVALSWVGFYALLFLSPRFT